ncbi:MAG: phospholipid/cholesterol/gamma-HCH transport system substrate-binding protein [Myxococcota bacterium]|jgi:phospholipid/cholesterol/gamma-HCH transport system substrate-binding protein
MTTTSVRTVFVGLFIAGAAAVFGAAILVVGSLQNAFTPKVTAHAVFSEVGGLQTGDKVWASGMRVGLVRELAFIEASKVEVTMRLNTSMVPFIPADSVATIGSDGLIGNPIIELSGGTPGGPPIEDGATLQIGEAVSTTQIMETLQENNQNMVSITADVKDVIARIKAGEGNIGRLLTEEALYAEAEVALADVQAASANARQLTASLARFSAALNQPGQLPYDLTHDDDILPSVQAAVADLEATARTAAEVAEGLSADANDPNTPIGVLLSDRESGSDVKETLANLEQATVLLNEDLLAIRSNFLFKPYFKKQERQERKEARKAAR